MKSGGELRLDMNKVHDTDGNNVISESELKSGVVDKATGVNPDGLSSTDSVQYGDDNYQWKDLKYLATQVSTNGDQITPDTVREEKRAGLLKEVSTQAEAVKKAERELANLPKVKTEDDPTKKESKNAAIEHAKSQLAAENQKLEKAMDAALRAGASRNDSVIRRAKAVQTSASTAGGVAAEETSSGGSGGTLSRTSQPPRASAMEVGDQSAAGQTVANGGGNSGGARGVGADPFSGLQPMSSAAYARALDADGFVSAGMDDISKSRQEGQRLMRLFMYYAKMAESGDLGAMYQFIKFITYIISKDKAKQNIQISTKLIQLQDMSRKATDALMKAKSDGNSNKEMNDFTKALQQARSDEGTISTSQKLLADILQEFAHVVEALVNVTKNMLDAWGRVLRTASSR
ncbi:MAG: hypothetical protein Q7T03_01440 [Deltaproteobacteria bacterium]|nr:hypothetical protein [Deltaproteobacteria bacterium]